MKKDSINPANWESIKEGRGTIWSLRKRIENVKLWENRINETQRENGESGNFPGG